jgi:hypothetical protein
VAWRSAAQRSFRGLRDCSAADMEQMQSWSGAELVQCSAAQKEKKGAGAV